jgi:hypothetical protein
MAIDVLKKGLSGGRGRIRIPKRNDFNDSTLIEYTLNIEGLTGFEADRLALEVNQHIRRELIKLNPMFFLRRGITIEESDIIYGSRKSKNKVKIRKKTLRRRLTNLARTIGSTITIAFTAISADYNKIDENWKKIVATTEKIFSDKNVKVTIEDSKVYNPFDKKTNK